MNLLSNIIDSRPGQCVWKALTTKEHPIWKFFQISSNRDKTLKTIEASLEGITLLMQTPLWGASEGDVRLLGKYRDAIKLSQGIHASLCFSFLSEAIPRVVVNAKEMVQIGLSLKAESAFTLKTKSLCRSYEGKVEKILGVTSKFFELIKTGGYLASMGPPRIISALEKLVLDEGKVFRSPYHEIGQAYEILAFVRTVGKTGSSLFEILLEGTHFYHGGLLFKKETFRCTHEGRESFRKDFEEIRDSEEKFIEFLENMTQHILNLLEGVPKLALHIIELSKAPFPPFVKFVLHIFSASIGLISAIRSVL